MATGRKNFILYEDEAEVLVESVARGLNSAGIPCVLWGHFLMHTHGIPTFIFVSPLEQHPPRNQSDGCQADATT
jgi:hypothetical protein